jgi:hypothetical protein
MKETSLAEVLASATALAFLLTVFYGFGFSMPLPISVFTYFTVNDYFRYSVMWLTPAAILVLSIALIPGIAMLKSVEYPESAAFGRRPTLGRYLRAASIISVVIGTVVWLTPTPAFIRLRRGFLWELCLTNVNTLPLREEGLLKRHCV